MILQYFRPLTGHICPISTHLASYNLLAEMRSSAKKQHFFIGSSRKYRAPPSQDVDISRPEFGISIYKEVRQGILLVRLDQERNYGHIKTRNQDGLLYYTAHFILLASLADRNPKCVFEISASNTVRQKEVCKSFCQSGTRSHI